MVYCDDMRFGVCCRAEFHDCLRDGLGIDVGVEHALRQLAEWHKTGGAHNGRRAATMLAAIGGPRTVSFLGLL